MPAALLSLPAAYLLRCLPVFSPLSLNLGSHASHQHRVGNNLMLRVFVIVNFLGCAHYAEYKIPHSQPLFLFPRPVSVPISALARIESFPLFSTEISHRQLVRIERAPSGRRGRSASSSLRPPLGTELQRGK